VPDDVVGHERIGPDPLDQPFLGHGLPGALAENLQGLRGLRCEPHAAPEALDLAGGEVDLGVPDRHPGPRGRHTGFYRTPGRASNGVTPLGDQGKRSVLTGVAQHPGGRFA
jgi:hypothetical protein